MRSDTHSLINRDVGQCGLERKKGNANQLESLFALKPFSLSSSITSSLIVIRLHSNNSCVPQAFLKTAMDRTGQPTGQ